MRKIWWCCYGSPSVLKQNQRLVGKCDVLREGFSPGLSDPDFSAEKTGLCSHQGDASRDLVHVEDRQATQPWSNRLFGPA